MERWAGKVALVTGASAGIGAAVAADLVKAGMQVIGCARREDRINSLAVSLANQKGKLFARKCDLESESDIRAMFEWIEKEFGRLDVCINNAGMAKAGTLLEGQMDSWRTMLNINVLGLCLCTQLTIGLMQKKGINDGHIVFVSSMSGHRVPPSPHTRFYSATKYAVNALLEGWRQELRDLKSNIKVSSLSPGLVETEFQTAMLPDNPEMAKAITSSFPCLQEKDMSDAILYMLSTPPHMQIHDILVRPTQQKF